MAWYQARRRLLDFVNHLEIDYGAYIETDCIKWVKRFGSDLRPLNPGESPKETFKKMTVTRTVEDQIKEVQTDFPKVDQEEAPSQVEEAQEEVVNPTKGVKPPVTRRKVKVAT